MFMNLGYRVNIALRCEVSSAVKAAVRIGMGVGILYRNAVASRVARGNLSLINVPELKELGFKSFIIYDQAQTPRSHGAGISSDSSRQKKTSNCRQREESSNWRRAHLVSALEFKKDFFASLPVSCFPSPCY